MSKRSELKAIQCVCTNLKMASRVVGRAYDSAFEETGINVVQYAILVNVSRSEPLAVARLAQHLEMERTTLYRALGILEKNGLLKVVTGKEGVSKFASLTATGRTVVRKTETKWKKLHEAFVDRFGAARLTKLNELLSEVRQFYTA